MMLGGFGTIALAVGALILAYFMVQGGNGDGGGATNMFSAFMGSLLACGVKIAGPAEDPKKT